MSEYNRGFGVVVARAIDILFAAVIWRDYDITISSLTGLELRKPNPRWWARALGWSLDHLSKGHCEGAIKADIFRAREALTLLQADVVWSESQQHSVVH